MKWLASLLIVTILALAYFSPTPSANAAPNKSTPTAAPSGTPISVGTTPKP